MNNFSNPVFDFCQSKAYVLIILWIGLISPLFGQTEKEETKQEIKGDSTEVDKKALGEKMPLRMSLEGFKINQEIKLVARVRSKVKEKFQNKAGVEISFYKGEVSPENFIGKDTSNQKGEAYRMMSPDTANETIYWAAVHNNPDFEDVEETVTTHHSTMEMTLSEEDSSRVVKVNIGYPDESGKIIPLKDAECHLYVQRMFGIMPLGDPETSDEEGHATFVFPTGIKGDESGNLTILAKIADNEIIGNVEVNKTVAWGVPIEVSDFYSRRELWGARSNAPLSLIFVVNTILFGIWGVIAFIFLEIIRINKLGKTN